MSLGTSNEFHQDRTTSQTLSMRPQKKSKPPPLVLCSPEAQYRPLLSPLAEFAAIATSPESPLVKEMSSDNVAGSSTFKLPGIDKVSSSTGLDTLDLSSCDTSSLSWPTSSLWERFNTKTFTEDEQTARHSGANSLPDTCHISMYPSLTDNFQRSERLNITTKTSSLFRPHNMKDTATELSKDEENRLFNRSPWSKLYGNENGSSRGLPCRELLLGDVCIPLASSTETTSQEESVSSKPQDTKASVLFDLDSAAQALSNMAKRKEEHDEYQRKLESTLQIVKRKETRIRKRKNANTYARRPMNAFMLFAKRYRLEITRKHPGKDNRAISVILGDEWKSLSSEDRKVYILEAKSLAEEHKRIYPDCWKRKRAPKVTPRTNRKH